MARPHPLFERKRLHSDPWKAERMATIAMFAIFSLGGFYISYYFYKHGGMLQDMDENGPPHYAELAPAKRADIAGILQSEGRRVGAELGLQGADFAKHMLQRWTACQRYYLVDTPGQHQSDSHVPIALATWSDKTVLLRMTPQEAAQNIPDDSLDYIYLASRHDYCGLLEDLTTFWPKLKRGGILAGHNYLTAAEARELVPEEDWGVCSSGIRNEGAVKGAVDDFARGHGLRIAITYRDGDRPSFIARKP